MKLVASIFLAIGLLFFFIGLGWGYAVITSAEAVQFSEEWVAPLVFSLFGLVFALAGGGMFYFQAKQKARKEFLLRTGRKLRGIISNVTYNTSITINNRHPLVIECVAEVSGRKQTFRSHNIWKSAQFEIGQEVAIYIDTRDHANYWVDVDD